MQMFYYALYDAKPDEASQFEYLLYQSMKIRMYNPFYMRFHIYNI